MKKFRKLNVRDECFKEALAIEVDASRSSIWVIRTQDKIIE